MGLADFISELKTRGTSVGIRTVRFFIETGRIPRPAKDGSRRFVFTDEHVERTVEHVLAMRSASKLRKVATPSGKAL